MLIFSFVLTLFISFQSQATEMVGAMSAGLGGTGRAAVQSNESLYLNPASLALMDRFYSGASYQTGFTDSNVSRNTYSFNLTDASPGSIMPGSFGFRRHKISNNGVQITENEYKVGLGYRLNPRLSLGVAFSHLSAENPIGPKFKQTNGDVGLLFGFRPNWGFSLSGENLLDNRDENRPAALNRLSRVALGTQYIYQRFFTARYEALLPLYTQNESHLAHRFGLGFSLKAKFRLNLGYSVDDSSGQNWTSAGLAWLGPRLKLAYSFQNEERTGLGSRHLVDLWFDL